MARTLADLVLLLHAAVVLFVVGGLLLVVLGNRLGWRWVNRRWFRFLHLAAIGVVVWQAWAGVTCPLTTLESWLRMQAGGSGYSRGFIEHWVHRLMFFEAPAWIFTAAYTAFAALVVAAWWRYPSLPPLLRWRGARASEAVVREFWKLMASNDFESVRAVLAPTFVLEWPQSNERIRGGAGFARMNAAYPAHGPWRFSLQRLVAGGGQQVVTQVAVTDGRQNATAVSFFTVERGLITRLVEYWPEPCAAPANRAHLTEPLDQRPALR